ncbi:hypothetical protein EPUS_01024 [Endocarpon pusillum Z07020]|uniref:Extracellular serine-rich protein n=1 Tax=Endocarpon pusillum (strain Z07020 / HMAS-L-300199) TaxID=1263415 RepID=U1GAM8_ENDPU|nr:uncharacterized protein EPUS_01024 [Endocarpon pusillum Z07020]ERF69068.1 hypothetical protein EPUS_01024 [Endocarpon pusillum Z07020]
MYTKSILMSSLLLAACSMAQDTTTGSSSQMTGPDGSMVSVQVVQVSNMNASLKFYPEEIRAEAGSMVQFQFYPRNHTVTQSTFDRPCEPINNIMPNVTGINSGPMPPVNNMMKVFTIMINDTRPLWMYCATGDHCEKGMVMVINAPQGGERTLQSYKALAARVSENGTTTSTGSANGTVPGGTTEPSTGSASSVVDSMVGATGVAAALFAGFALLL